MIISKERVENSSTICDVSAGGFFETTGLITAHGNYDFVAKGTIDYTVGGVVGHAAFNDATVISGAEDIDHNHSFQAYLHLANSGTIKTATMFYSEPRQESGTITNLNHFHALNPQQSGGAIGTLTGLRIAEQTKGTTNYAIVTEGATPSVFGGNINVGGVITATGGIVFGSAVVSVGPPDSGGVGYRLLRILN